MQGWSLGIKCICAAIAGQTRGLGQGKHARLHPPSASFPPDPAFSSLSHPQAKLYSRDAVEQGEFIRGDMYIRDMKNTKGHVSGLCGGQWHPTDRYTAMTCSEDGTVRIWDTQNVLQVGTGEEGERRDYLARGLS